MSLAVSFHVGYSKSPSARCHGPPPCKGTLMPLGTLRMGKAIKDEYTESVEWRHWGCVTFDWLRMLRADKIVGLSDLQLADRNKIQMAISLQRVDPTDIPPSAQPPPRTQTVSTPSSKRKRKGAHEGATSQANLSASSSATTYPSSQQVRQYASLMESDEYDQTPTEEDSIDELYATLTSRIAGMQYYRGLIGTGEEVRLIREPQNRFDSNAIQVKNISNIQVGHIKRDLAARLSPLLDRRAITIEGVVVEGNVGSRSRKTESPISISVFGPSGNPPQLKSLSTWATSGRAVPSYASSSSGGGGYAGSQSHGTGSMSYGGAVSYGGAMSYGGPMTAGNMPSGSSSSRGGRPSLTPAQQAEKKKREEELSKAAELSAMVSGLERVDNDERRQSLLDTLCDVEDVLALPIHPNPPGIAPGNLTVNLLKHQSQALAWALEKEHPKLPTSESAKPVQFWQLKKQNNKTYYYNIATKTPQDTPPQLGRGGLNGDAMGLGKTLTMLSLILATIRDVPTRYSNATLVVCPLSILSNWEKQIEDHVSPACLKFCVYHGSGRSLNAQELSKFDIVITTYQTVAGEFNGGDKKDLGGSTKKKRKIDQSLFEIKWKRVILDEGHSIRNPKTKMTQACCGLNAERRWVLSGTPIINSPRDLGSILSFLRICAPLDNDDYFKRLVIRPLKNASPEGAQLLRGIMSSVCLRRTKEMQDKNGNSLVPLPPVEMIVVPVTLTPEARALYDEVEAISKEKVTQYISRSSAGQSSILSLLTRMRQIVLHPGLVPAGYVEQLRAQDVDHGGSGGGRVPLSPEMKARLQNKLSQAIEDLEECPICFMPISEPRITFCGHPFCLPCITEVINRDPKCPMDRKSLSISDLVEPLPPNELALAQPTYRDQPDETEYSAGSSAKIQQLIHLLRLSPRTEKSLVFSQFTTFLDKIGEELSKEGIPFARFDGKMSAKRRQETLNQFSVPLPDCGPPNAGRSAHSSRPPAQHPMVIDVDKDGDFVDDGNDDDDFILDVNPRRTKKNKGKQKASSEDNDDSNGNPRIMLISLKAGALGLNLTVANNVYLMDPWWQEGIESQAIDRVNRIGQTKDVHVYQLIAENTVESKVLDIQDKKKKIISEAFSGIKARETHRTQREARLQDLIELFGIRQQNGDPAR